MQCILKFDSSELLCHLYETVPFIWLPKILNLLTFVTEGFCLSFESEGPITVRAGHEG